MGAHRHDAPPDGASQRVRLLSQFIESSVARLRDTRGRRNSDGLVYMGLWHDAIPRPLITDPMLSPVDKAAWLVIRIHAAAEGGASFPTYEAFARCNVGARATIARALAILRLTRWVSLCSRVRDSRSRFRGNVYAIHEEPAAIADAILLDGDYMRFLHDARSHGHPQVRNIAEAVLATVEDRVTAGEDVTQVPDLAQRTLERVAAQRAARRGFALRCRSKTERPAAQAGAAPTALTPDVSKTELPAPSEEASGSSSKTERGENDRVQKLNSDEKIEENQQYSDAVQKLNAVASCSSSSFIKTTTTTNARAPARTRESSETELPPVDPGLRMPPQLSANELALVRMYIRKATAEQRPHLQDLLFELQGRLQIAVAGTGKPIPNPVGYFVGMLSRLEDGAFALSSCGLAAREYWANQDRVGRTEAHRDAQLRQTAAGVALNVADPVARRLESAHANWMARKNKKSQPENPQ